MKNSVLRIAHYLLQPVLLSSVRIVSTRVFYTPSIQADQLWRTQTQSYSCRKSGNVMDNWAFAQLVSDLVDTWLHLLPQRSMSKPQLYWGLYSTHVYFKVVTVLITSVNTLQGIYKMREHTLVSPTITITLTQPTMCPSFAICFDCEQMMCDCSTSSRFSKTSTYIK